MDIEDTVIESHRYLYNISQLKADTENQSQSSHIHDTCSPNHGHCRIIPVNSVSSSQSSFIDQLVRMANIITELLALWET